MLRSCFKSPDIENIKLPPLAPIPTDGIYEGLVAGYPRIAGEMSVKPQLALFRRFGALNARNLMYLQNDLANLERALKEFECADSLDARGKKQLYARDYHTLDCSSRDSDTAQLNIFLRVREKLKEYSTYSHIVHDICLSMKL